MSQFLRDYDAARRHAQEQSNSLGVSHGVARTTEYGKKGFVVRMIPGPNHRFGSDATCEPVEPMRRREE